MEFDYVKCGDSLQLLKEIPDKSIDLVVTDPPYILDTTGAGNFKKAHMNYVEEIDSIKNGFDLKILDELCRVMKKINIYMFCSQKQITQFIKYFAEDRNCNFNLLTWHKTNPIPTCGNKYLNDTEYILFFREKGVKIYGSFNTKHTYYLTPLNQKDKNKYNHPTVKPIEIINNLIINSSKEDNIVLDPFMGTGTTCVSCISLGRHYIGYEIDKDYIETAKDRIEHEKNLKKYLI